MTRVPRLGPHGEGWVVLQLVCFVLVAVALWLAPPVAPSDATTLAQSAGYAVGAIGAVLIGSGLAELRRARALTAIPYPLPDASLAQTGAYRFARHPIYGGLILGALGLALISPWAGTFAAAGLLAIVLDLKRRREEIWLAERYPEYEAYRRRTKALIPFLY